MKISLTLNVVIGATVILVLLGLGIVALYAPGSGAIGTAAVVMIFLFGGAAAIISMVYVKRVRLKRISDREALSPEQIFLKFYKKDDLREDVVISIWREIAQILALPAEKLRPTDKFNEELKPLAGWYFYDDHLEHLFAWTNKCAGKYGAKVTPLEFKTVDDLVRWMGNVQMKDLSSTSRTS